MTVCSMKSLLADSFSGEWGSETGDALTPVLRTANFNEDGSFDYDSPAYRCIPERKVRAKRMRRGDIVLEKSGGTPNRPVGIMAYYDNDDEALCSNFNHVLRFDADSVNSYFMFHQLRWLREKGAFAPYTRKTTGLQNLQMKAFINLELTVPSRLEQDEAAMAIRAIDLERNEYKSLLGRLDELVKSRFVEMFERDDWPVKSLDSVADVQGGLTKNKKREKYELQLPYLRVANVLQGELDLSEMLSIGLTEAERDKTLLQTGDMLFVEGNGSRDQIGRLAIWDGSIDPCVHQNHLIRARLSDRVLPVFALAYFSSPIGREQIVAKAVSTSGLFTLSTGKIKTLFIPVPPLALQREFAAFVQLVDKLKFETQQAIDKLQLLYDSLAQECFGG